MEILAGERSYSYALDQRTVLLDQVHSFGRDAHGAVREEGDTHLASPISHINPGDQWVTDVAARAPSHPRTTFFFLMFLLWLIYNVLSISTAK